METAYQWLASLLYSRFDKHTIRQGLIHKFRELKSNSYLISYVKVSEQQILWKFLQKGSYDIPVNECAVQNELRQTSITRQIIWNDLKTS